MTPNTPGVPTWPWLAVVTTVDTVMAGTTLTNITGLSFAVEANEFWSFWGFLVLESAATTEGLRVGYNAPSGFTRCGLLADISGAVNSVNQRMSRAASTASQTTSVDAADTFMPALFTGLLHNGSTAGSVQIQFAGETAGAINVTCRAGSVMHYRRIK